MTLKNLDFLSRPENLVLLHAAKQGINKLAEEKDWQNHEEVEADIRKFCQEKYPDVVELPEILLGYIYWQFLAMTNSDFVIQRAYNSNVKVYDFVSGILYMAANLNALNYGKASIRNQLLSKRDFIRMAVAVFELAEMNVRDLKIHNKDAVLH